MNLQHLEDEDVQRMAADRRDFHQHAEPGWCEVRTASKVARRLADLGFAVRVGRDVVAEDRAGLPEAAELEAA